ncbi:ankyrin repeat domain-containing protein [Wolbachia endosymbiont (group A) of Conops quadrifasciatus]|uniref:ankyrin repeat domain-containing protein n=1 Tax=Wolbachia endosymbiont (group A) of Conops quadrifasciatus TaxID=3066143 RepID=UPI003132FC64
MTGSERTQESLNTPTEKLFKAIDDKNLEAFKQALAEGADVNAFDAGYTPLMTIIMRGDGKPICLRMMMLLLQHQNLNVNIQETKERNTALHLAFCMGNRNFIRMLLRHPKLDIDVKNSYLVIKPEYQQLPEERLRDSHKERFFHTPEEYIRKIGEAQDKDFSHLTVEIQKAQRGEQLLNALSDGNINQAKALLEKKFTRQDLIHMGISPGFVKQMFEKQEFVEQMLNPNIQNGEIETPLSLIIKSCLQGITQDNKEVLTKLLKHKDLDFSQIKPIQAIEQNSRLKKIIEQAITERLTNTINRKDLEDVKELVEDNCFMSRSVVVAAWRNVNNPIESIVNYLNEKFPANTLQPLASTNDIPVGSEQVIQELKGELERTRAG